MRSGEGFLSFAAAFFAWQLLATAKRLPVHIIVPQHHSVNEEPAHRVFYQSGTSEEDLPVCSSFSVCNKIDTYERPWVERQCRCADSECSMSLDSSDGHTIVDRTRQFKLCEPVRRLPKCKYFHDVTWTLINSPSNSTEQILHCHCPKGSVAYLLKRHSFETEEGIGFRYSFACSPQSRLRCQRKEPCRLFTVRKLSEVNEGNTNTLCQCPNELHCPRHHSDPGVIPGKTYTHDSIRTYSGYCI